MRCLIKHFLNTKAEKHEVAIAEGKISQSKYRRSKYRRRQIDLYYKEKIKPQKAQKNP